MQDSGTSTRKCQNITDQSNRTILAMHMQAVPDTAAFYSLQETWTGKIPAKSMTHAPETCASLYSL